MIIAILYLSCAWTESFESQDYFPPNDWMIINEDALDACWYRDSTEAHTGIHSATCYSDSSFDTLSSTNRDYLLTPQVLPSFATNDTLISFWYRTTSSIACSLDILVSESSPPSTPSFSLLRSLIAADTAWTQRTVSLSMYNGVSIYIAFRIRRIPTDEQIYLDDITLPEMTGQPQICSGRLRTKGPPAQKYLQVWGDHYAIGYAHGYLLGEEIKANWDRVIVGSEPSYHWFTSTEWETEVLPYFRLQYAVPQKYQDETQGLHDGMIAKGVDLYHEELGRMLTLEDLQCCSASAGFSPRECSSVSGWGESTTNDDTLQGGLVIARNYEGGSGKYTTLGNTSLIIAFASSEVTEQKFFMVTMAGFIGLPSGVNEQSVGLCRNSGNHPDTNYIPPNSLIPIGLSCRNAVETVDPDSNGAHDIFDIVNSLDHSTFLKPKDIHLFSQHDTSYPISAGVLEINNIDDSLRLVTDNSIPPAINSSWNLAVTNHDRVLYLPEVCPRYQTIADSLNADFHLSTKRAVAIANSVARAMAYQSMVIRPDLILDHPDWPCVGVSYACRYEAAHLQGKHYYSWNELFDGVPGVEDEVSPLVKKTSLGATIISGSLRLPQGKKCRVFDITGRVVTLQNVRPGVYFIEIDDRIVQKVVKIR